MHASECSAARGNAFLPHTLRQVRTAERTQAEITIIAEMEDQKDERAAWVRNCSFANQLEN